MNTRDTIQNELSQLSTAVANIPFVNVYTIPHHYFEQLPQSVLLKVQSSNILQIPQGYFEQLPTTIWNKIKATEQEDNNDELPEILKSLQKINVYKAPKGYFESISLPTQEAKVVGIKKNYFGKWLKIAAAACVISIISFVGYTLLTKNNSTKIDSKALAEYNKVKNLNVENELDKLNEKEVDNYFCEAGLIACADNENDKELDKELEDLNISDEEMQTLFDETTNN